MLCGGEDDHPVVGVSWEDAQAFNAWLSAREGRVYRLPTDEEWSVAVGLGRKEKRNETTTPEALNVGVTAESPWGKDYPPETKDKAGNYADTAFAEKFPTEPALKNDTDGFATTAPVMSFKPDKPGIYDLGGNAAEWVEDWWNDAKADRTARGNAFSAEQKQSMFSSLRLHFPPSQRGTIIGFRIVLEAP